MPQATGRLGDDGVSSARRSSDVCILLFRRRRPGSDRLGDIRHVRTFGPAGLGHFLELSHRSAPSSAFLSRRCALKVNAAIRCYLEIFSLTFGCAYRRSVTSVAFRPVRHMKSTSGKLALFLGSLSPEDRKRWDTLTPARRRDAEARFEVFEEWAQGNLSAEEAIARFGKSPSRFYRLAAQWRERPGLDALGVGIRAPRSRAKLDPDIVNALQAKVAEVVRLNADASVSRQTDLLLDAAGFRGKKPIGTTALRKIVETERRRIEASGRVGHQISLDCTAINLPQEGGCPYILYALADLGTGLVLGWSFARSVDVASGYSAAASDAIEWMTRNEQCLPWSTKLTQTVLVAGEEGDRSEAMVERLIREGVGGNVLRASGPRRFGSQIRKIFGERLGRVQITPARTLAGEALPDNGNMTPWAEAEVRKELRRTFDEHNDAIMRDLDHSTNTSPPASLTDFLEELALIDV